MPKFDLTGFELDHVSVSQLRTFLMCGVRWYFDVVGEKVWTAGSDIRLRGQSLDHAANEHYLRVANTDAGLPKSQFIEAAVAEHDANLDTHEFELSEAASRDRLALQASEYRTTFGDFFQPWAAQSVQEKIRYEHEDLLSPVVGVIDLTTKERVILDNKVRKTRNVPSQGDVDRDFQLTTYAMMQDTRVVALAVVSDEKTPKPHLFFSQRTDAHIEGVKHRYNEMVRAIRAGILHPAPERSWYCSPKWCAYWTICPYGGADDMAIPGLME